MTVTHENTLLTGCPVKRVHITFIMDLSFDPELTDELMVIHFNLDKQPYYVAHES